MRTRRPVLQDEHDGEQERGQRQRDPGERRGRAEQEVWPAGRERVEVDQHQEVDHENRGPGEYPRRGYLLRPVPVDARQPDQHDHDHRDDQDGGQATRQAFSGQDLPGQQGRRDDRGGVRQRPGKPEPPPLRIPEQQYPARDPLHPVHPVGAERKDGKDQHQRQQQELGGQAVQDDPGPGRGPAMRREHQPDAGPQQVVGRKQHPGQHRAGGPPPPHGQDGQLRRAEHDD